MKVNVYYNNDGASLEEVMEDLFIECYLLEHFSFDGDI